MKLNRSAAVAFGVAVFLAGSAAQAAIISCLGPSNYKGAGNGTVIGVLSLQAKSNDNGIEWGGTGWNGTARTFANWGIPDINPGDDSQNKTANGNSTYQALSQSDLMSLNLPNLNTFLSNFAVTFQVGEGNGSLQLQQMDFNFYAGNGTDLMDVYFPGPAATDHTALDLAGTGQGTAGYIFAMNSLTPADVSTLNTWWNSGGYFGVTVSANYPVTNAHGESDNFFAGNMSNLTVQPAPEPGTLGAGLIGVGLLSVMRGRKGRSRSKVNA